MFAKIELKLKCEKEIRHQMASLFHGVLMECIDTGYAEYLHRSETHPYSSHLELRGEEWFWVVSTLNEEAYKYIIEEKLSKLTEFKIENKEMQVQVLEKKITKRDSDELEKKFYQENCSRYVELQILTPMSFKQRGRYVFAPDVRLIYQSLINKYDKISDGEMFDEDTLEYLIEHTFIANYNIRSMNFYMEGVKIPGFIGKLILKINGAQTMVNFGNILFEFGEYSGIGIKSSIGMGAVKIIRKGEKHDG